MESYYEQILLLPQCFQTSSVLDAVKWICRWERVKQWKKIVANGEITHYEQFLLLSLCFQKIVCRKCVMSLQVVKTVLKG